ncbi:hypothetical protein Tco_1090944 [Tanacetum coccineum]|uniref:Reverse transcriptase domain-containing protein n=1 Tax=Tanacetum coccineum TaxID=301880 RepID=A0ABQ5I6R1_9ASTR
MEARGAGPNLNPPEEGGFTIPDLPNYGGVVPTVFNGPSETIAPIAIQATTFGLKNDMIQQVQNSLSHVVDRVMKPNTSISTNFFACLHKHESEVGFSSDDALRHISSLFVSRSCQAECFDHFAKEFYQLLTNGKNLSRKILSHPSSD